MEMDRRKFLKTTAASAAVVGGAAALGTGVVSGASPNTHHGWQNNEVDQYFDRKPFEIDESTYRKIGETSRPTCYADPFYRMRIFIKSLKTYNPELSSIENLAKAGVNKPEDATVDILADKGLADFYSEYSADRYLEEDARFYLEVLPFKAKMDKEVKARKDNVLHNAYFNGYTSLSGALGADGSNGVKSKEYDFEGVNPEKFEFKDPKQTSELIKKVATLYGSPIVRITKLNPDWVFNTSTGGRGYKPGEKIDIPSHWKYAIVVGSPMEWDAFRANPSYGHSMDGYMNASTYADRLTKYIKELGYPARPNSPMHGYDVIVPPIAADAGVGEIGRMGVCISPDFGGNFRPAIILTDLPLEIDKPIDAGIETFCKNCKICAEQCPSESIMYEDKNELRGYETWHINSSSCRNYWFMVPISGSCRLCITVCPFSKQSGWIHQLARDVAVRDKTGLTAKTLTWMEKNFFGEKEPSEYMYKLGSYEYPTAKEIPWWLDSAEFLKK